jgi:capsular polysaccharide biosynthesis protein
MLNSNEFFDRLSEEVDGAYTSAELKSKIKFSSADTPTELFTAKVDASSPTAAQTLADTVGKLAPEVVSSLSNIGAEVKVVDEAQLPSAPSSPNVMRNTLIAAIAGFAVMLIIVYAKEMLDTKIRYSSDMTELRSIPVLSAVPDYEGCHFHLFGIKSADEEPAESEAENG